MFLLESTQPARSSLSSVSEKDLNDIIYHFMLLFFVLFSPSSEEQRDVYWQQSDQPQAAARRSTDSRPMFAEKFHESPIHVNPTLWGEFVDECLMKDASPEEGRRRCCCVM